MYRLQGEHDMQKEIMTYGPVEGTFMIHEDFGSYKSGMNISMFLKKRILLNSVLSSQSRDKVK